MRKYWKTIVVAMVLLLAVCLLIFQKQFLVNIFGGLTQRFLSLSESNRVALILAIITTGGAIIVSRAGIRAAKITNKGSKDQYKRDEEQRQKEKCEQQENTQFDNSQRQYKRNLLYELKKIDSAQLGSEAQLLFSEGVMDATLLVQREARKDFLEAPMSQYDPVQRILELERDDKGKKLQAFLEDKEWGNLYTLYGGPGSGKTLYLKIMALKAAKGKIKVAGIEIDFPIYIDLKDFVKQSLRGNDNLLEFIVSSLQKKYGFPENQTLPRIGELLGEGKALLLLDGSSEMPKSLLDRPVFLYRKARNMFKDMPNSYGNIMSRIYTQLSDIKGKYGNFPTIITARMPITHGEKGTCLIIEDITPETARFFINCSYTSDKMIKERIPELESALENFPRLRNFASTPLALSHAISMCLQVSEHSLLRRRTELYQRYIDTLLSTRKSIDTHRSRLTNKQKLDLLAHIAWELHFQQKYCLKEREIRSCIKTWLDRNQQKEREQGVLEELVFKHGLLREHVRYKDVYEFSSLALQEYFAMLYVPAQASLLDHLYDHRNSPWWEEVIALFIQYDNMLTAQATSQFVPATAIISQTAAAIPATPPSANATSPNPQIAIPASVIPHPIKSTYQLVETLAGLKTSWNITPSNDRYYADLLLAGKGLVNVLSPQSQSVTQPGQTSNLQTLYHGSHNLLVAGKGLVTTLLQQGQPVAQTAQNSNLQTLHHEIHTRLYSLLVSPTLASSLPLFVQQQIASILLEEGIKNVNADTLNHLHISAATEYDNIKKDLEILRNWLKKRGGQVPTLFLPLLVPLLKRDPDFIKKLAPKDAPYTENLLLDFRRMTDQELEQKIVDKGIAIFVRKRFIYALCIQRRYSFCANILRILTSRQGELEIRKCLASALGILSNSNEDINHLFELLEDGAIPDRDSIHWNIINALGTLIDQGHIEVVARLAKYLDAKNPEYQDPKNPKYMKKATRLNIASILLPETRHAGEPFNLGLGESDYDDIVYDLAQILLQEDNDHHFEELLLKLSSPPEPGGALPEEAKVWICEILARVCKNKEHVKKLKNGIWETPGEQLKEALDYMQWLAIRRQNSETEASTK